MQKAEGVAKSVQRKAQSSTTLNRRYVKRPSASVRTGATIRKSSKIQHFAVESAGGVTPTRNVGVSQTANKVQKHPMQVSAINQMQRLRSQQMGTDNQTRSAMTAKEIKERAIQQALASTNAAEQTADTQNGAKKQRKKMSFGFGRVALALSCAAVAVLAIVYFVKMNVPDLSLRVAAMQTGISASYPGYIPRGYTVSSITSESKKVVLDFKNSTENTTFNLTEESSTWDSNALLNNYVKGNYGDNYKTIKEQGLTIYIDNSNATWVNGGIIYKITAENGVLTNKQICSIATSL